MKRVVHRGVPFDTDDDGVTDARLLKAEAALDMPMPPAVAEFFRAVNGGECEHEVRPRPPDAKLRREPPSSS
jgi:hypothetical protein